MKDSRDLYRIGEQPCEKDKGTGWTIVRPNAFKPDTIAIVSNTFFPTRIHHFKGQTIACRKTDCPACLDGNESRWRGYLLGVVAKSHQRVIMECSAEVEQILLDLLETYTTLRGLVVVFTRTKKNEKAKHHITFLKKMDDESILPPDRDVWPIICRIFGIAQFVELRPTEKTEEDIAAAKPRRDAKGQRTLRRNQPDELEALVNSGEERQLIADIIEKNLANGNGRHARK